MKRLFNNYILTGLSLILGMSLVSCEAYLDKEPESTVSEETAFVNFRNFQGFIEEIYNCIPDKEKANWCPSWNWGDDEVFNTQANDRMTNQVDLGNFRAWMSYPHNWLYIPDSDPTATGDGSPKKHGLWQHSWYCIRKANLGLQAIADGKLVNATEEERTLLEGQLYFFRAWWHFELINWFGGLPYIDKAFDLNDDFNLPRLSYQECADKCAEDFRKAADLLPINWDNTDTGKATLNKNELRINKIMALAYLGKCYLWASSPLMELGAQTGASTNGNTYKYDNEYAQKAADALGELLALVESGQTQYALAEFNYDDIYNHTRAAGATSAYSDNFYTRKQNWKQPGTVEAIFRGPSPDFNASNWNTTKVFGPKVDGVVEHDNVIHQPTANAVEMYGMANGLPLSHPESGYDPKFPFKDRDPRFYHDIVFDGFKYINGDPKDWAHLQYCKLYTGGNMRDVALGSRTGYFIQKLVPHTANSADREYDWGSALHTYLPYLRLADVYLMYAEATAVIGGRTGKSDKCDLTSEDAVNKLRDRVGAGHVHESFTGNSYMDEIRRERAVELMFEGHRFNDLQRWLLLTEAPYTEKYSHEFTRVNNDAWYKTNDPKDAEVVGFTRKLIVERHFDTKHYWFPLPDSEVYLYEDFPQNPGW